MERDLSIHQGFRLWQMRFLNPSRKGQLFHRKLPAPRGLPVDEPAFCLRFWKGNPMDGISFSERVLLPSSEERSFQAGTRVIFSIIMKTRLLPCTLACMLMTAMPGFSGPEDDFYEANLTLTRAGLPGKGGATSRELWKAVKKRLGFCKP